MTSLRQKDEMVRAICKEAEMQRSFLDHDEVSTVYFGGGTPSLLEITDLAGIMNTLRSNFTINKDAEVTLEANPDDINEEKLTGWKECGINRLSIGVQSFFEQELVWMNRAHNSEQSVTSLQLAKQYFDNISMDLIYGSPLLTNKMWEENINRAVELRIPHLSCYALTIEEKTPLHKSISKNEKQDVDSDRQAEQFLMLMNILRNNGYEHYEVSNFALPGYRSRHNSSYWKGDKYLGLGPSAHSFDGNSRQWNVANNNIYIRSIETGNLSAEKEMLTDRNRLNEFIMISLRTKEGLDLAVVNEKFGNQEAERLKKELEKYVTTRLLNVERSRYSLTDEGMLRADGIAAEMFV